MRISSINVAQPRNLNFVKKTRKENPQTVQTEQPSFKGWKAGVYGVAGTALGGVIAGVLSGGALLPILLLGSAGTAGGCIYGSSKEDNHDNDSYDCNPCYPNYRD